MSKGRQLRDAELAGFNRRVNAAELLSDAEKQQLRDELDRARTWILIKRYMPGKDDDKARKYKQHANHLKTLIDTLDHPRRHRLDPDDEAAWAMTPAVWEPQADSQAAFNADAIIWYNTLFVKGNNLNLSSRQEEVLGEQQQLLKRHFLTLAYLNLCYYDDQKQRRNTGQEDDNFSQLYVPIEDMFPNIPLAALVSHGGRIAYEKHADAVGSLTTLLLTGLPEAPDDDFVTATQADPARGTPNGTQNRSLGGKANSAALAGLYRRASSHPARFDKKRQCWLEIKVKSFDQDGSGLGLNIPLGGVGNVGPNGVTIGPEGKWKEGRSKGNHGSILFICHEHETGGEHLMIGHEGSGPGADSQVGAHDLASMLKEGGNARSLTGQLKGSTYGVPSGLGAIKAQVSVDDLAKLEILFKRLEGDFKDTSKEKKFFRQLLMSTKRRRRKQLLAGFLKATL